MSYDLLQKLAGFLDDAGLLAGYAKKYLRWTDGDVQGNANFVLFRMAGTAGARDSVVQRPDVRILVVVPSTGVVAGHATADAIFAYLAGTAKPADVYKLEPLGTVMGPYYLENGRGVFEIIVRCFVGDH